MPPSHHQYTACSINSKALSCALMAWICVAVSATRDRLHHTRLSPFAFVRSTRLATRRRCTEPFKRTNMRYKMAPSSSSSSDAPPSRDLMDSIGLPRPLILGSGSFTRKLILEEMGIDFHLLVRSIDEKSIGDRNKDAPSDLVLTLAKAKCDHLVSEILSGRADTDLPSSGPTEGWVVLTGDQVVTHEGEILEKPEDVSQAKDFVRRYARSPPMTVGAVVLTHVPSGKQVSGVDRATIAFKQSIDNVDEAGRDLIDLLLADNAPVLSCAGGLMVEHPLVREHLDRIDGTEDSVMGLSKELVLRLLQELRENLGAGQSID